MGSCSLRPRRNRFIAPDVQDIKKRYASLDDRRERTGNRLTSHPWVRGRRRPQRGTNRGDRHESEVASRSTSSSKTRT